MFFPVFNQGLEGIGRIRPWVKEFEKTVIIIIIFCLWTLQFELASGEVPAFQGACWGVFAESSDLGCKIDVNLIQ
jgi:hypothetical protein